MDILAKVPPNAKEVENDIIGVMLLEKDAFDTISEILKPESFYVQANQIIFRAAQRLSKKSQPIDLTTVTQELINSNEIEKIGGAYHLTKMTNGVVSGANLETWCKIVFEKSVARDIIKIASEVSAEAYNQSKDIFDVLGRFENKLSEIGLNSFTDGMAHFSDVLVEAVGKIEQWRFNDSSLTGVPSGFPGLDTATRGWQPGDLILLAARPSKGKTAFALNIIKSAAMAGHTVAVWSLEMKSVYLALRMMSEDSEFSLYRLQVGAMDESQMETLYKKTIVPMSKLPIFFSDGMDVTIPSVIRRAKKLKKDHNLGLIVIDYVQLLNGDGDEGSREREVAKISRSLKRLAMELDIPIIALSQLNRTDGEKGVTWEYGPPTSSLRECGALEQDADLIMMLWGANEVEISNDSSLEGKRKVRIAKHRNGVLITDEFDFNSDIQRFEVAKKYEQQSPKQPAGNWRPVTSQEKNELEF